MLLSRSGGKFPISLNHSAQLTGGAAHVLYPLRQFQITICFSPFHFHPQCPDPKTRSRKHRLNESARRALEMLASDPATVSIMLDQGFTRRMLSHLVSTGLAMLRRSPLRVGSRTVDVSYIKITAAGRHAIGD
jgi:hypothetical protein